MVEKNIPGRKERLERMVEIKEERERLDEHAEKMMEEAGKEIKKAYKAAETGDLYKAYVHLDAAIKAHAAAGRNSAPQAVQWAEFWIIKLGDHWNKVAKAAREAADNDPKALRRYETALEKLAEQREENERHPYDE